MTHEIGAAFIHVELLAEHVQDGHHVLLAQLTHLRGIGHGRPAAGARPAAASAAAPRCGGAAGVRRLAAPAWGAAAGGAPVPALPLRRPAPAPPPRGAPAGMPYQPPQLYPIGVTRMYPPCFRQFYGRRLSRTMVS